LVPLPPFLPSLPLSWLFEAVLRATLGADFEATFLVARFVTDEAVPEARLTGFLVSLGGLGFVVFLAAVLRAVEREAGSVRVERDVVDSDESVERVERERVDVVI
jgi:hypothetical protein